MIGCHAYVCAWQPPGTIMFRSNFYDIFIALYYIKDIGKTCLRLPAITYEIYNEAYCILQHDINL